MANAPPAAAGTPAQQQAAAAGGPRPPSTPPISGARFRTGDDIDPMKDERSGLIREVGCQAIWSLSSCKPGFGVDQLRDQSLENYWQSDGQLPHLVNIQFRRKMTVRDICIYTDFKLDESYTPSKISIRCGTHFNDLQEVELVEFSEPSGWVQIFLKDIRDRPIRTFMLQLAVLSNHQNGRDTHLRQIRIHSPVDNLPVAVFPGNFTSLAYVSIWLHQLVKGFRDKDGNPLPNAHLLGVFHRVCKLLNYGIKPVFVFDGGIPALKRQTLAARRQRKIELYDKAEDSRQKILAAYLRQQLQRNAKIVLPPSLKVAGTGRGGSPKKRSGAEGILSNNEGEIDDLEAFREALAAKMEDDIDQVNAKEAIEDEVDSEEDEGGYRYGVDYSENFGMIQGPDFDTLPLETQHEILFEMQESRKMNSWGKFDKMPKDLKDFSHFQMDRLVKRRALQKKIQSVQQEMGQRHIHVQNLDELLKLDFDDGASTEIKGSQDDGYLLIKSSSQTPGKQEEKFKPGTSGKSQPSVITIDDFIEDSSDDEEMVKVVEKVEKFEKIENEEEKDLKLAIQLSLQESQKQAETLEKAEASSEIGRESLNIHKSEMSHCAKFLDTVGFSFPSERSPEMSETTEMREIITNDKIERSSSESEDDEEFEDVEESTIQPESLSKSPAVVATIDMAAITAAGGISREEDIFADIFLESNSPAQLENKRGSEGKRESEEEDKEENELVTTPPTYALQDWENRDAEQQSESDIEADLVEMVIKESMHDRTCIKLDGESKEDALYHPESQSEVERRTEENDTEKQTSNKNEPVTRRLITAEYMQEQAELNAKLGKLQNEMGRDERHATSISDQMMIETQELISLFGIPYVISPTEAESQCAFLDRACLTEGSITDDSDVWLFGGQRVFKNFFSQGEKHVELYQAADIQRVLNLNREKLIALAIMIGNDYSDGISGVGPVLALEILSEFASPGLESFSILCKFKEWWEEVQNKPTDTFSGSKLKEKLRKLKLRPGFPSEAVYDAFMNPSIDTSTEPFKWGNPDLDAIRSYTKGKFGWEQTKCDSLLLPVLKKRQCELDQSRQLTLDSYISIGKLPSLPGGGGKRKQASKRVENAVKRLKRLGRQENKTTCSSSTGELNLSEDESESEQLDEQQQSKRKQRPPPKTKLPRKKQISLGDPQSSSSVARGPLPSEVPERVQLSPVKLSQQVIPQRVQAETDRAKNKQKAIEIFKKKRNGK